jgi:hypothetical protein
MCSEKESQYGSLPSLPPQKVREIYYKAKGSEKVSSLVEEKAPLEGEFQRH